MHACVSAYAVCLCAQCSIKRLAALSKRLAMDQQLCVEFWRHVLVENGFQGGAERETSLARFIVQNQFTKLAHLAHADHPSEWWGAEGFADAELEAVWGLKRIARKRSRCVFGVVLHMCVLVAPFG